MVICQITTANTFEIFGGNKMKNKNTFTMTYSAQQQEEIQSSRQKYMPAKADKMEQLRALDASATKKATVHSLVFGIVGTMLLGIGMSLAMSNFGAILGTLAMPVGILTGIAGIGMLSCAYPVYQRTLKREQEKIAPEIIRLTDELMDNPGH